MLKTHCRSGSCDGCLPVYDDDDDDDGDDDDNDDDNAAVKPAQVLAKWFESEWPWC